MEKYPTIYLLLNTETVHLPMLPTTTNMSNLTNYKQKLKTMLQF